jgi:hypothetical protein
MTASRMLGSAMAQLKIPTPRAEALKPLLWVLGLTLAPTAIASFSDQVLVTWVMLAIGVCDAALFFMSYWHLLTTDPDRLQSETYMALQLQAAQKSSELAQLVATLVLELKTKAPELASLADEVRAKALDVQTANNAIAIQYLEPVKSTATMETIGPDKSDKTDKTA